MKLSLIVSVLGLFMTLSAFAQTPAANDKGTSDKAAPTHQVEPKTTKHDAKLKCRSEGKSGRELVNCIKEQSKGEQNQS